MYTPVVEMTDISFSYANGLKTLEGVSLEVEAGQIYGFLGPNGSGKTTTLRLLLGLLSNQQGNIRIFGKDLRTSRLDILKHLGSLIESPSVYNHLTAKENLEVYREIYHCKKSRLEEVLRITGLSDVGGKAVKNYSLGMKTALIDRTSLLPEPELLILDEPSNGLDPTGIIELRHLIRDLNREQGMTIIISSHNLTEVEKMVSHVGIILEGKMLFQGALAELASLQKTQDRVLINTSDNEKATKLLLYQGLEKFHHMLSLPFESNQQIAAVNRLLMQNDIGLYHLQRSETNLEQLFITLTTQS